MQLHMNCIPNTIMKALIISLTLIYKVHSYYLFVVYHGGLKQLHYSIVYFFLAKLHPLLINIGVESYVYFKLKISRK